MVDAEKLLSNGCFRICVGDFNRCRNVSSAYRYRFEKAFGLRENSMYGRC